MDRRRLAFFLALVLALLTTAVTVRYATFVAWGTDAAGYVGAARRWAERDLFKPAPLQLWAPWSFVGPLNVDSPLAYKRGLERGTDVSFYPLGFPILLAVAHLIDRDIGVYLVPPLFAGLLVWCTFLLGRRLAGPWAGVLAALLVAANPITIGFAVTPMSDVTAAALLVLALEMSLRRSGMSAAAAGAAMAAAIMVRPVLAPLAVVSGVLMLKSNWKRAALFSAVTLTGPLMVGWSQHVLYGGFFTSGYPGAGAFFKTEHIAANLRNYPKHLVSVHTPVIFLGLACVFVFFRRREDFESRRLALALCAIVLLNFTLYLPFLPYDLVWYLRFLLPAIVALLLLLSGVLVWLAELVWHRARYAALLALAPAVIVVAASRWMYPPIARQHAAEKHVLLMGHYLDEVLPSNAAVITFIQSAGISYYTNRQIIRFDLIQPNELVTVAESLVRHNYHPVFVIDKENEGLMYKNRFANTPLERLDWRPRAQFVGATTIWFLDYEDRDGRRDRTRAPIDVLK